MITPLVKLSQNETAITNGLVGHWELNEGSGLVAGDIEGYNNGGITNGTWGFHGGHTALTQSAAPSGVYIRRQANYSVAATGWSMTCWVKFNALPPASVGNRMWILVKGDATSGWEWFFCVNGYNQSYGLFYIGTWNSGGSSENRITGATAPTTGVWYHCAGTIASNGANVTPNFYLNGTLNNGSTSVGVTPSVTNADVYIGKLYNASEKTFNGSIRGVRLYNRALTATEVAAIYAEG